jgi:hypothetical protein
MWCYLLLRLTLTERLRQCVIELVYDLLVLIRITLCRANLEAFPLSPASKPQPVDIFNPISSSLDDNGFGCHSSGQSCRLP